jgi:hypothetical protein
MRSHWKIFMECGKQPAGDKNEQWFFYRL